MVDAKSSYPERAQHRRQPIVSQGAVMPVTVTEKHRTNDFRVGVTALRRFGFWNSPLYGIYAFSSCSTHESFYTLQRLWGGSHSYV
jgi:hypothetical protein